MNPNTTTDTDYQQLFSQLIKKQMLVLGPDITLAKVRNVTGITVDINGDVQKIEGDPQILLQSLINQFVELSGMIVKKTMESILTSYPGMMAMAATGVLGGVQGQSQPQAVTQQAVSQTQKTLEVKPDDVASSQVTDSNIQEISTQISAENKAPEPPLMAEMKLDSLGPSIEKPKEETFTNNDMAELNKALEELSNAPVSTEQTPVK